MGVQYANNASTLLTNGINNSVTSFDLDVVTSFPTLATPDDYMYLTIIGSGGVEIIKVTDITGLTVTCVRGQDGTSALAASAGDPVELRVTTATLRDQSDENRGFAIAMGAAL